MFPRPRGTCLVVDVGALARLEMSAAGPFAHGSRGAVGRRGIPGLNSFGERNLGLRIFSPLVTQAP